MLIFPPKSFPRNVESPKDNPIWEYFGPKTLYDPNSSFVKYFRFFRVFGQAKHMNNGFVYVRLKLSYNNAQPTSKN